MKFFPAMLFLNINPADFDPLFDHLTFHLVPP